MNSVLIIVLYIMGIFTQIEVNPNRADELSYLKAEYMAAREVYGNVATTAATSDEHKILLYEALPEWKYAPRFIALAQANPADDTAFECCMWIIDCCDRVGNLNKVLHDADSTAWEIIAKYHNMRDEIPQLCLRAAALPTAAREKFLRDLPEDWTQSVEVHGYAILGLAELLARKSEVMLTDSPSNWANIEAAYKRHLHLQAASEWKDYFIAGDASDLSSESQDLFNEVSNNYAEIFVQDDRARAAKIETLGDWAEKRLRGNEKFPTLLNASAVTEIKNQPKPLPGS